MADSTHEWYASNAVMHLSGQFLLGRKLKIFHIKIEQFCRSIVHYASH